MATVVCYGDSNTHGAAPVTLARFPRDVRWPGVLAAELAGAAEVIEEGLNGRTTLWNDPFMGGRNGRPYLLPCLRSHAPVDVLVLMLGTNDLKSIFGRQPHEIAAAVGALIDLALASGAGPGGGPPKVLLLAPPRLGTTTERSELWGFGAARAASDRLPRLYAAVAELRGVAFLDASALVSGDPADGVHLSAASHGILGRAVAEVVRDLLWPFEHLGCERPRRGSTTFPGSIDTPARRPDGRAPAGQPAGVRKVRAPQRRVAGNARPPQGEDQCHSDDAGPPGPE